MTTEKVTLKDVYAIVNRIEDKVDTRFSAIERQFDVVEEKIEDNTRSITRLETKATLLGSVAGVAAGFFYKAVVEPFLGHK